MLLSLLDGPLDLFLLQAEVVKALLLQGGLLWLRLDRWGLVEDHYLILVSLQRVGLRHFLVNEDTPLGIISFEVLFRPFVAKDVRFYRLHKVSWPKILGVD